MAWDGWPYHMNPIELVLITSVNQLHPLHSLCHGHCCWPVFLFIPSNLTMAHYGVDFVSPITTTIAITITIPKNHKSNGFVSQSLSQGKYWINHHHHHHPNLNHHLSQHWPCRGGSWGFGGTRSWSGWVAHLGIGWLKVAVIEIVYTICIYTYIAIYLSIYLYIDCDLYTHGCT